MFDQFGRRPFIKPPFYRVLEWKPVVICHWTLEEAGLAKLKKNALHCNALGDYVRIARITIICLEDNLEL